MEKATQEIKHTTQETVQEIKGTTQETNRLDQNQSRINRKGLSEKIGISSNGVKYHMDKLRKQVVQA